MADAVSPKTTQSQIDRLEKGARQLTQAWMEKIAAALNVEAGDLLPSAAKLQRDVSTDNNTQRLIEVETKSGLTLVPGAQALETWPKDLRIIGHAKAGVDGMFLDQGEHHGMAYRPPALRGVKDAFAVYVHDISMVPAFKPGRVAWVHPARPVFPGDDVLIELADGQAFIKELVRRTATQVICRQWNPDEQIKFDAKKVNRIYCIVGSYREE